MKGALITLNNLSQYLMKLVQLEISSNKILAGYLIDYGLDILVIFDGKQYFYIPRFHIQNMKLLNTNNSDIEKPTDNPMDLTSDVLSVRKVLTNAKGMFTEIYVTGKQPLYGYITNIMNDYFVFTSPVYKSILIPLHHLKWLIPFYNNQRPYSLDNGRFSIPTNNYTLARTFDEQVKKFEGKLVVFDLGDHPDKIGQLKKYENSTVELITGRQEKVFWNISHLKMLYLPNN